MNLGVFRHSCSYRKSCEVWRILFLLENNTIIFYPYSHQFASSRIEPDYLTLHPSINIDNERKFWCHLAMHNHSCITTMIYKLNFWINYFPYQLGQLNFALFSILQSKQQQQYFKYLKLYKQESTLYVFSMQNFQQSKYSSKINYLLYYDYMN